MPKKKMPEIPLSDFKEHEVVKRTVIRRGGRPTGSKYDFLMSKILELGADEVLVVPPGAKEWPPTLDAVAARFRLKAGLGHLCKKHGVTILVERLEGRGIGISRTDV